mmetsp:Transcript_36939/g.82133  ORF Transcript_36939/g.82133 Transcript_36939/m.82133 type:complete len:111 (+) Transcript_36939:620-952(+)
MGDTKSSPFTSQTARQPSSTVLACRQSRHVVLQPAKTYFGGNKGSALYATPKPQRVELCVIRQAALHLPALMAHCQQRCAAWQPGSELWGAAGRCRSWCGRPCRAQCCGR